MHRRSGDLCALRHGKNALVNARDDEIDAGSIDGIRHFAGLGGPGGGGVFSQAREHTLSPALSISPAHGVLLSGMRQHAHAVFSGARTSIPCVPSKSTGHVGIAWSALRAGAAVVRAARSGAYPDSSEMDHGFPGRSRPIYGPAQHSLCAVLRSCTGRRACADQGSRRGERIHPRGGEPRGAYSKTRDAVTRSRCT